MREKIIAGNWKCFKTMPEARKLTEGILAGVHPPVGRTVVICPPFPYLSLAVQLTGETGVQVGGQNIWGEDWGAYTGEISAPMLVSLGVRFVIIGHSERRIHFHEDGKLLNQKLKKALTWDLRPIFCLGETLSEREGGRTFPVVEEQLEEGLADLSPSQVTKMVIAYEPIWAIGTGKNATPDEAQEVHAFLRRKLAKKWGGEVPILYGGSVKPDNIDSLMAMPDVDGALVGGASLEADCFLRIVHFRS